MLHKLPKPRTTRRRWILGGLGALLLLLVFLGLCAIPLLSVPGDAQAARTHATAAVQALKSQDTRSAREHVERARELVDATTDDVHGFGGDVWSWVPLAGGAVRDVQHLADALDELTHVLEIGVEVYPQVVGEQSTLVSEGPTIDLDTLDTVIAAAQQVQGHTGPAVSDLQEVEADTPFVGDRLAAARDAALEQIEPIHDGLETVEPLWEHLPDMLGAEGRQTYVVAFLNPAELHYSGGTPLSFAPITFEQGRMTREEPLNNVTTPGAFQPRTWDRVRGNDFHRPKQALRITQASTAPSWSVSGKELTRAWNELRGRRPSGILALDVVALQELMAVTGPIEVPGYGILDSTNLVEKLVGSYDELTSVEAFLTRAAGEQVLISTFQGRLFQSTNVPAKARALAEAAESRHLAMYFRDAEVQDVFAGLGFAGDLSETPYGYIGVFNQAVTGHKADYWQRRTVRSDVRLAEDGSARVRLEIEVFNDSPPPATGVFPSFANYVRRDNHMSLAAFLPEGAEITSAQVDGEPLEFNQSSFRGRPFTRATTMLAPRETSTYVLEYDVPQVAVADGDTLTYRLAADPQGMVDPEALEVTVHWPEGYAPEELPEGWTGEGGVSRFATEDFEEVTSWEIPATR